MGRVKPLPPETHLGPIRYRCDGRVEFLLSDDVKAAWRLVRSRISIMRPRKRYEAQGWARAICVEEEERHVVEAVRMEGITVAQMFVTLGCFREVPATDVVTPDTPREIVLRAEAVLWEFDTYITSLRNGKWTELWWHPGVGGQPYRTWGRLFVAGVRVYAGEFFRDHFARLIRRLEGGVLEGLPEAVQRDARERAERALKMFPNTRRLMDLGVSGWPCYHKYWASDEPPPPLLTFPGAGGTQT